MTKRFRRISLVAIILLAIGAFIISSPASYEPEPVEAADTSTLEEVDGIRATEALEKLAVKDWAAHDGYARDEFGSGWSQINGCDTRNVILKRDMPDAILKEESNQTCIVLSGTLQDPYTGSTINFVRGTGTSSAVQIDHVVALSNAWVTGAQDLEKPRRRELANDPLNLLAVDGPANQQKSDSDAASWLPPNKSFRCQYVARQISVKYKYVLWVTPSEKSAMSETLKTCPNELAIGIEDLD